MDNDEHVEITSRQKNKSFVNGKGDNMQHECKITVLETKVFSDLQENRAD